MTPFQSINPYTEEHLASFDFINDAELLRLLEIQQTEQKKWKELPLQKRLQFLPELGELLRSKSDELAEIACLEMGKLRHHAKAEVLKSASLCEYYFNEAENILKPEIKQLENGVSIRLEPDPMGVILGIFPWNFPFWQILRSAIPCIVSGNSMLIKPAPNVPQSSLALQAILDTCTHLPKHIFTTIFANEEQVSILLKRNEIKAVTLTGSERAGASIAQQAAAQIKPSVLELGGSDALIILNDAPLEKIIDQVLFSRFQNNGQSCVAAKRFLVQDGIMEKFKTLLIDKMKAFSIGNPMDETNTLGPQARKDLLELLQNQVAESVSAGATILYQSESIPSKGFFFPPTVLTNIPKACRAYTEELFGPVLSLYNFSTIEEAISIANDTRFGLGASIFTSNPILANEMAQKLECGMVYINQIVKSDVKIPFGGSKNSGFGRELGPEGLKAFCQVKAIWG
ncbi:MAG: succinate-semialdehyde dehydrogenase [Bacteroidetes bacterium B1(2017)]|nr:MAG: succinate-semialdehyde dehydrogenase [Bacteroidetes bacterium B1(2017)]